MIYKLVSQYRDSVYAFLCGFIPSSVKTYLVLDTYTPFISFVIKIMLTMVLGFFCGLAGLLAKDVYKWVKDQLILLFKKKISKKVNT